MIVFDLQCTQGHGFEGWFASGEAFERQLASDLVHCPVCDVASVTRVPSARVSVPKGEPSAPSAPESIAGLPPELLKKLREAVRGLKPGTPVTLQVQRDARLMYISFTME